MKPRRPRADGKAALPPEGGYVFGFLKVKSMEVGEGDEHAHLVAHRRDLIPKDGHFPPDRRRSRQQLSRRVGPYPRFKLRACSPSLEIGGAGLRQKLGAAEQKTVKNDCVSVTIRG